MVHHGERWDTYSLWVLAALLHLSWVTTHLPLQFPHTHWHPVPALLPTTAPLLTGVQLGMRSSAPLSVSCFTYKQIFQWTGDEWHGLISDRLTLCLMHCSTPALKKQAFERLGNEYDSIVCRNVCAGKTVTVMKRENMSVCNRECMQQYFLWCESVRHVLCSDVQSAELTC